MKDFYYYLRQKGEGGKGVPRITVCILYDSDSNRFSRGIAFASLQEKEISKKKGRAIARARAVSAQTTWECKCPIGGGKKVRAIMEKISVSDGSQIPDWKYKSEIAPLLSPFEMKLVESYLDGRPT